jgi:hypothetical protein
MRCWGTVRTCFYFCFIPLYILRVIRERYIPLYDVVYTVSWTVYRKATRSIHNTLGWYSTSARTCSTFPIQGCEVKLHIITKKRNESNSRCMTVKCIQVVKNFISGNVIYGVNLLREYTRDTGRRTKILSRKVNQVVHNSHQNVDICHFSMCSSY